MAETSTSSRLWRDHFQAMPVRDYIPTLGAFTLSSCNATDSIVPTLKRLAEKDILSMPVKDAEGHFYAFVDTVDIVSVAAQLFEGNSGLGDFYAVAANDAEFAKKTVGDVVGRSNRNPFFPVSVDDTMLDVIKVLTNRGVHRVPVMKDGEVIALITQSNVVDYVDTHKSVDPLVFDRKIEAMTVGSMRDVVTVYHDTRALQGFRLMDFARVSGVAVVEEDGSLLAVMSSKDLRLVASQESAKVHFEDLLLSSREFVMKAHEPDQLGRKVTLKDSESRHPLSSAVHETATIGRVLHKLHVSKVHRIFVVDNLSRPVGCIALRDVLAALLG